MSSALIVGNQGQDGRLLEQSLLKAGYDVVGISRNQTTSSALHQYQNHAGQHSRLDPINIENFDAVSTCIQTFRPDQVYFLAAYHHSSEEQAQSEIELWQKSQSIHFLALVNFLEAIRLESPKTRLFYAASSHVFGAPSETPQTETTCMAPLTAYGVTKLAGMNCCHYYRVQHRIFASCGILYTHESEFRSPRFLAKKIIQSAVAIHKNQLDSLTIGNLHAEVDWGAARDYVEAYRKILEHETPDHFIVATGINRTVQDFVQTTFDYLDLDWKKYVKVNPQLLNRTLPTLRGDPSKLKKLTGWTIQESFENMIRKMLDFELREPQKKDNAKEGGKIEQSN